MKFGVDVASSEPKFAESGKFQVRDTASVE